jgi:basic membrane protein A
MCAMLLPACAKTAPDCTRPEVFCVGLVTDVGRLDDKAYNQAAWQGVEQAKTAGVADWTASIETVDARDYEENVRVFAEAGYDVIVTVGEALGDATRSMAEAYPSIYFIGIDQDQQGVESPLPNLVGLVFPEEQLGYLAGVLAASMTQTGLVGAILGSDAWPPMRRYGEGFEAGVVSVSTEVAVTVTYHNEVGLDETFDDPKWGAATAAALIKNNADILFTVGGTTGTGALIAAAKQNIYVIGAETDEYYTVPEAGAYLLTSVLKQITPGTAQLIELAGKDQRQTEPFPTGNYLGQVSLAPYHDLLDVVPQAVQLRMSDLSRILPLGEVQILEPTPTATPTAAPTDTPPPAPTAAATEAPTDTPTGTP